MGGILLEDAALSFHHILSLSLALSRYGKRDIAASY